LTRNATVDRNKLFDAIGVSAKQPPRGGRRRLCEPADFRRKVRGANLISSNPNRFGIPQGTAISALLSNVYMLNFDEAAKRFASSRGGKYMRYCDDMLFILPGTDHASVTSFAEKEIEKLKLSLNPDKTAFCVFKRSLVSSRLEAENPLQYLGFCLMASAFFFDRRPLQNFRIVCGGA